MLTPNFNFHGDCAEAIELYKKAFGARVDFQMSYADADPADLGRPATEADKGLVYHSEVKIGGQRVMMSDNMDVPFTPGLALSLVLTLDTKEEVMQAYEVLSDGARRIIYPPRTTTYSSREAVLVDKFGIRWGIMTEQTER